MNFSVPALIKSQSKRTTFLSEGVKLCGIISAICIAPLAFVQFWIAIWLLFIFSAVALGTFGIWAFSAVKNRSLLDSEEHAEQMAAIAIIGQNRDGKPPLLNFVDQTFLTTNPDAIKGNQDSEHG